MKISRKQVYTVEMNDGEVYEVHFIRIDNCPGFSHKVIIMKDGGFIAKDWLSARFRMSTQTVKFYMDKHIIAS